jgi:magnesium transporter
VGFQKPNPEVEARPGTLAIPEGSPPPTLRLVQHDAATVREETIADGAALAAAASSRGVTWVDVQGLGDETSLRRLGALFGLDGLALEDAVDVPQRAKSEVRDAYHLVVARLPVAAGTSHTPPQVYLVLSAARSSARPAIPTSSCRTASLSSRDW